MESEEYANENGWTVKGIETATLQGRCKAAHLHRQDGKEYGKERT
jgi:hypothetical protein